MVGNCGVWSEGVALPLALWGVLGPRVRVSGLGGLRQSQTFAPVYVPTSDLHLLGLGELCRAKRALSTETELPFSPQAGVDLKDCSPQKWAQRPGENLTSATELSTRAVASCLGLPSPSLGFTAVTWVHGPASHGCALCCITLHGSHDRL